MSDLEKIATQVTVEEYLEGERKSETRHEYVAGDIYAKAGASRTHNIIALNIADTLRGLLRGSGPSPFHSRKSTRTPACDPAYSFSRYAFFSL